MIRFSDVLIPTTGGIFIMMAKAMMEKHMLLPFRPKLPPAFLSGIFPTINWNKLMDTLSKRWTIRDNLKFFIFTLPHGPLETCHNLSRILPDITNRRSVQAQTSHRSSSNRRKIKQRFTFAKKELRKLILQLF